ncbi:hypothetical protein ES708_11596 [subsurface metagenome]
MADKNKRIWSVVCPACGRSYKKSVWDKILGSRLRGILAFGQGFTDAGRWAKADVAAGSEAELDAAVGAGFFSLLKARLLAAIDNWFGNGWLDRDDLREVLNKVGKVSGGFPVMSFGPGAAEGGCRRDVAAYVMGSEELDVVRSDSKIRAWG